MKAWLNECLHRPAKTNGSSVEFRIPLTVNRKGVLATFN